MLGPGHRTRDPDGGWTGHPSRGLEAVVDDLRSDGIEVTSREPLKTARLFGDWLATNVGDSELER